MKLGTALHLLAAGALVAAPAGSGLAQRAAAGQLEAEQAARSEAPQREVQSRERELERARLEMERARGEMEAAAREVARLSGGGPQAMFFQRMVGPGGPGQGRIGATIQNADQGALIVAVTPGGAADEAGLMSGDVVTSVNGVAAMQLGREPTGVIIETIAALEPGTAVPVEIVRAGEKMTFDVEVREPAIVPGVRVMRRFEPGDRVEDFGAPLLGGLQEIPRFAGNVATWLELPGVFAGRWRDMELVTLTDDLGAYFGTDTGLLVVRAPGDDQIGLRDGDVILEIGGRRPTSPEHAIRILTSFVPGETLELSIMRRQRRQSIEYTIPAAE